MSNKLILPIGVKIQRRREELKMPASVIARECGFTDELWADIEAGRKVLKIERLMQVADILNMDPDELLDGNKNAGKWDFVDGATGEIIGGAYYMRHEHQRGGGIFQVQFPGKGTAAVQSGKDKGLLDLGGYITKKVIEKKIAQADNSPMKLYRDPERNNRWYAYEDMQAQYRGSHWQKKIDR